MFAPRITNILSSLSMHNDNPQVEVGSALVLDQLSVLQQVLTLHTVFNGVPAPQREAVSLSICLPLHWDAHQGMLELNT